MRRLFSAAALAALGACSSSTEPEWSCLQDVCFNGESVTTDGLRDGQMIVLARDDITGHEMWVGVDCVARIGGVPGGFRAFSDESAFARACDTWGTEE